MRRLEFKYFTEVFGVEPWRGKDVDSSLPLEEEGEPEGKCCPLRRDQGIRWTLLMTLY